MVLLDNLPYVDPQKQPWRAINKDKVGSDSVGRDEIDKRGIEDGTIKTRSAF